MFRGLEHSFPNIFSVWNMMGYLMHCIIYSYMHIYINHWTCDVYRIIAYLLWIILLLHDVINFLLSWVRINYWITFLNFKWNLFVCYSVKYRVLHYHIYTCHFILHKVKEIKIKIINPWHCRLWWTLGRLSSRRWQSFQVTTQFIQSRGWVDPVPDPTPSEKS
jgi:hypothetical protein